MASSYLWRQVYGIECLYSDSLFTHQLSHVWIDFRGVKDAYMRGKDSDHFENSGRATMIQQQYAIHNPMDFGGYSEHRWGLTACDGPGPGTRELKGIERRFYNYIPRGVPFAPDDGTIAPWAVVALLSFAPEIVLPTIEQMTKLHLMDKNPYGFKTSFNPTYPDGSAPFDGWISASHYGFNQRPIDSELSDAVHLGPHAKMPVHRHRPQTRWIRRRLAVNCAQRNYPRSSERRTQTRKRKPCVRSQVWPSSRSPGASGNVIPTHWRLARYRLGEFPRLAQRVRHTRSGDSRSNFFREMLCAKRTQ